jgi:1-acyl-sn-glycerol-3-phosphate acyltransferase
MWPSLLSSFRILIFFGFLIIISPGVIAMGLLSQALNTFDPTMETWLARSVAKLQSAALHVTCKFICLLFCIRVRAAEGMQLPDPDSNPLIVANHISYLDIIAVGSQFRCSFLAKEEVRGWPLIGPLTAGLGCLYLKREDLGSRVAALKRIKTQLKARAVCVFPEGSTTRQRMPNDENWNTGQTWTSLPDATESKCVGRPIIAIAISYEDHESAVWVDDMAFLPHLFKTLKAGSTEISIRTKVHAAADMIETTCARERSWHALASIRTLCPTGLSQNFRERAHESDAVRQAPEGLISGATSQQY